MIRHILFIAFKDSATQAQIDEVSALFLTMPQEIGGIQSVEWGRNDSPEALNKDYTHCVVMTFDNDASRVGYLEHPAHNRLKDIFLPLLQDIIVLDYSLAKNN